MENNGEKPRLEPFIAEDPFESSVYNYKYTYSIDKKVEKIQRPWGLALFCATMLLASIVWMLMIALHFATPTLEAVQGFQEFLRKVDAALLSPTLTQLIILMVLNVSAAFLLWEGSRLGCSLTLFMMVWALSGSVWYLQLRMPIIIESGAVDQVIGFRLTVAMVALPVLLYFFRSSVLAFCRLNRIGVFVRVLLMAVAVIGYHYKDNLPI